MSVYLGSFWFNSFHFTKFHVIPLHFTSLPGQQKRSQFLDSVFGPTIYRNHIPTKLILITRKEAPIQPRLLGWQLQVSLRGFLSSFVFRSQKPNTNFWKPRPIYSLEKIRSGQEDYISPPSHGGHICHFFGKPKLPNAHQTLESNNESECVADLNSIQRCLKRLSKKFFSRTWETYENSTEKKNRQEIIRKKILLIVMKRL